MAKVKLKHSNEYFDSLFRRFKKAVERDDVIKDIRQHEYFEKPSEKRKRAKASAIKRDQKRRSEKNIHKQRKY